MVGGAGEESVDPETFQGMNSGGQVTFLEATQANRSPPAPGTKEEQLLQSGALMSVAEDALAHATEVRLKRGEDHQCWGCHGLERYADTLPHLYGSCLHQDNLEVKVRACHNIDEYIQSQHGGCAGIGYLKKKKSRG